MMIRTAAAVGLLTLAAACSQDDGKVESAPLASSARQCFQLSQVSGYHQAGKDRIRVSTGPRESYEFEVFGPCPDLDRAENLGFDPAGSGTICNGIDVDLIVPTDIGPRRCPVRMIRKLEPAG